MGRRGRLSCDYKQEMTTENWGKTSHDPIAPPQAADVARALWLEAPRRWQWREEAVGTPGPGEARVRTLLGSVSVGAELALYRGEMLGVDTGEPRMTGYENLAVVEATGDSLEPTGDSVAPAAPLAVGDVVVGWYGHRDRAVLPQSRLLPVPPALRGSPVALLAVLGCDVARAVRRAGVGPGQRALVLGAGALGLLTIEALIARGVGPAVVETRAERVALAHGLGAISAPDARGFDVAFDCSGDPYALGFLAPRLRRRGTLVIVSDPIGSLPCLPATAYERELAILVSSDADDQQVEGAAFLARQAGDPERLASLFSESVDFRDLPGWFRAADEGRFFGIKPVVRYPRAMLGA